MVLKSSAAVSATGPDGALPVRDGVLTVPLHLAANGKQTVDISLATTSHVGDLEITYYPRSLYLELGSPQQATILMFTTLPRTGALAYGEGAEATLAPEASVQVDRERWSEARRAGDMPAATLGRDEEIRLLYLVFDRVNHPTIGQLCDEELPGIDTYYAMSAQRCFVWCTGYSRMLRDFLRSSGTPARLINLTATSTTLPGDVLVESSEGHQTTELWDGTGWAWIDATLRVLRALDADGRSLSTADTIIALSNPDTRDGIRFTRLDSASGAWVTQSYRDQDNAFKAALASVMTPDKLLSIPNGGRG